MVFTVYADSTLIHHSGSPAKEIKVINPKLVTEVSASGSFSCSIPPENVAYDLIDRFTSIIQVYRDDKLLFEGRIIEEEQDFWKNRQITCEGALSYLNDTTQPLAEYHALTVRGFLERLLTVHNNKVDSTKTIRVGTVTVTDPNDSLYRYTNFESTLECIKDKLLDRLGGYLVMRYENGARYLDYLAEPSNTNTQTIEFGKNLLDFSKSWDYSDFATVVVPQGARLDESPIEGMDAYLDVKDVNSGSIYVYDPQIVNAYGWIEVVVKWSDVTVASNLLRKAQAYLSNIQFDKMVLEVNAVDLSYMGGNVENIEVFDKLHCISRPHGMDRFFTVSKVSIPLDNPANTTFTLGDNIEKNTLSATIRTGNKNLQYEIDDLPSTTSVLDEAKENADQIMRQLSNGYITTIIEGTGENAHSEALIISDTQDWTQASRYWKWNVNGLAYYRNRTEIGLALTMDGAIVADRITTGTMSADRVRTGLLTDYYGYNYWNLTTGEFRMMDGHATIDGQAISSKTYASQKANTAETNAKTYSSNYTDRSITAYDSTLDQIAVFNKLTNNGAAQGLIKDASGNLYINATYISTGILADSQQNIVWDLSSGRMLAENLRIETTNFFLDYDGEILSGPNYQKIRLYNGDLTFEYYNTTVGGLYADSNGLNLSANELYINGTRAETTDSTFVRASNGQVMGINFDNGIFTGYSLSGDYGYSGWVSNVTGINNIYYDGTNIHWDVSGCDMYFSEGVIQQVDSW